MAQKRFHPFQVFRDLGSGNEPFTLADATCHVGMFGATGSGKTSGSGHALASGYLASAAEMGTLVLCAKSDESDQWLKWAEEAGRDKGRKNL
jgi:hypothetical protein